MYNEFENEDIISEFQDMVKQAEEFKSDMDSYCEYMKKMFLKASSLN